VVDVAIRLPSSQPFGLGKFHRLGECQWEGFNERSGTDSLADCPFEGKGKPDIFIFLEAWRETREKIPNQATNLSNQQGFQISAFVYGMSKSQYGSLKRTEPKRTSCLMDFNDGQETRHGVDDGDG